MPSGETEEIVRLFTAAVPEIRAQIVKIRAVARKAGWRTKIAVSSFHPGINPVNACCGDRGSRLSKVFDSLPLCERIDVIPWDRDPARFIENALYAAEVLRVKLDEELRRAHVLVPQRGLWIAEGRRGLNRKLASELCGWEIQLTTVDESGWEIMIPPRDKSNT